MIRIRDTSIGKLKELLAKVELYKGDNISARIFQPAGVDSRPLDGDVGFSQDSEDTEGGKDILGFIDQKNEPISEKGEYRTYARDPDGKIVGAVYLKKDGTLQVDLDKDLIQNIAGEIKQTVVGNVTIEAPKFSFGNGTDELISEAIKAFEENEKLVGPSLLGGNVDSPGVSSTGTNSLIAGDLATMKTALGAIITALKNIQV